MANGIRVSEQHGVNPTVGVCFWCGGDTGCLALLGRLKGDVEAPRKSVISYEPCKDCKEKMERGIALMEVEPFCELVLGKGGADVLQSSNPRISKDCNYAFTGRFFVLSENLVKQLINNAVLVDQAIKSRKAFIPPEVFKLILRKLSDAGLVSE